MENKKGSFEIVVSMIVGIAAIANIVSFIEGHWWKMESFSSLLKDFPFWTSITASFFTLWVLLRVLRAERQGIPIRWEPRKDWIRKFGVYWDKDQEAFCPICLRTPLGQTTKANNIIHCPLCEKDFLLNEGSTRYPLDEAKKAIREGKV